MLFTRCKKIHKINRGFTLVELMVAVSLFSFVSLMIGSIVFSANAVNDRLASSRAVYEAINLVLDDMTREISQGTKYRCLPLNEFLIDIPIDMNKPRDCENTQYGIAFKPSDYSSYATTTTLYTTPVSIVGYTLDSGVIKRYMGVISLNGNDVDGSTFGRNISETIHPGKNEIISPPNVIITRFSVTATNTGSYVEDSSNIGQAYIQIVIEGETNIKPIVPFSVQATITQREPEN